jgi:hypothetical protein
MSSSSKLSGRLSSWLETLRSSAPNELGPGQPAAESRQSIDGFRDSLCQGAEAAPQDQRDYVEAAVALWALHQDCLDQAHTISQELKSALGSYIHGIVHRREPDYSNAKYWFRQVRDLPFYAELQQAAREELAAFRDEAHANAIAVAGAWRPTAFVDLCEMAARGPEPLRDACRRLQQRELELMLAYCLGRLQN